MLPYTRGTFYHRNECHLIAKLIRPGFNLIKRLCERGKRRGERTKEREPRSLGIMTSGHGVKFNEQDLR